MDRGSSIKQASSLVYVTGPGIGLWPVDHLPSGHIPLGLATNPCIVLYVYMNVLRHPYESTSTKPTRKLAKDMYD